MLKTYRIVYWSILAGIILLAGILELVPAIDGLGAKGSMMEFCMQYAMILITLATVYAALKMVKKNPIVRMGLLEAPTLINIVCYHFFMNASFGYLAIVSILAYAFVFPGRNEEEATDENKDEI